MSQKKVDYYKEQKRNRAEIMRKEKRNRRLGIALTVVILAALCGWFGYLVVQNVRNAPAGAVEAKELDVTDMDAYFSSLDALVEGESTEEAGSEVAESGETVSESTASESEAE